MLQTTFEILFMESSIKLVFLPTSTGSHVEHRQFEHSDNRPKAGGPAKLGEAQSQAMSTVKCQPIVSTEQGLLNRETVVQPVHSVPSLSNARQVSVRNLFVVNTCI